MTAQRKVTREKGPATKLEPVTNTLLWSVIHKLSATTANPSFPIALCTHRLTYVFKKSFTALPLLTQNFLHIRVY